MNLKYFILGFTVKVVASIDDTVTRIPVLLAITKNRSGKIAFAVGNMLAITVAIFIAIFFSSFLSELPGFRYIVVALFVLLAMSVYFDWFWGIKFQKPLKVVKKKKIKVEDGISLKNFLLLVFWGLVISLLTLLDDTVVFIPLFAGDRIHSAMAILGIYSSSFIQLTIMVFFAEWLEKLPYLKEFTSIGLLLFALLFWFGLI